MNKMTPHNVIIDNTTAAHKDYSNMPDDELAVKLSAITKEMNQFTYIVSHDLQAPLRMITGFLELLEKKHSDQLNESARQYIEYAVKGAYKMRSLIVDLLEYSRLSSVVNDFTAVDLNEVLPEAEEKFKPLFEESGCLLTKDKLPVVQGDKKQLTQLFVHLIGNALKFRNSLLPEIKICLKKEKNNWLFAVSDNGIGFNHSFADKIFIVFRRLHADESKYSGNGIGLAVCKKIVELHQGKIWVESVLGKGTTLFFTLPV
jgi:light-regulated signal transduction histidine kinase (bacteriophytochrome)